MPEYHVVLSSGETTRVEADDMLIEDGTWTLLSRGRIVLVAPLPMMQLLHQATDTHRRGGRRGRRITACQLLGCDSSSASTP